MKKIISWLGLEALHNIEQKGGWSKFLIGITIAAVIMTISLGVWVSTTAEPLIDTSASALGEDYPADMVLTIQDGELTSTQEEPFIYSVNQFLEAINEADDQEWPLNLLVIDAAQEFSYEGFEEYNTAIAMFRNSIAAKDDGQIRLIPYDEYSPADGEAIVVTKDDVTTFLETTAPQFLNSMKPFIFTIGTVGVWVMLFFQILIVLLIAFLSYTTLHAFGRKLSFGIIFQHTMRASLVPMTMFGLIFALTIQMKGIVFWGLLAAIMLVGIPRYLQNNPKEITAQQ